MTAGVQAHRADASRRAPGSVNEYRARGPALCGNKTHGPSVFGRDEPAKYSRKVRAQSLIPELSAPRTRLPVVHVVGNTQRR
jgi:hypothetical protein